jgi:DNA-binding MarR family transcriptional regulator
MAAPTSPKPRDVPVVFGEDGFPQWSRTYADAWIGLLATHRRLTRELDAELEALHGLTLSGLELLARLASAPGRRLRLSVLATEAGLSLSRVSRIVDALEDRGLVERQPCPADARAINAQLTGAGLELARSAQATHLGAVRVRFFDKLSDAEIAALAEIFGRLSPDAGSACAAGPRELRQPTSAASR